MSRNTPQLLCVFVIIPLSHGSADSVDQQTDSVCSSGNYPFRRQYPNGVVLREEHSSVRVTPTFWWAYPVVDPYPVVETRHKGLFCL